MSRSDARRPSLAAESESESESEVVGAIVGNAIRQAGFLKRKRKEVWTGYSTSTPEHRTSTIGIRKERKNLGALNF